MIIDTTKSALDNVLALVNSANSLTLTGTDVAASAPVVQAGTGSRNTKVTLTSQAGGRYSGNVDVSYYRTLLSEGTTTPSTVHFNASSTLDSVLTAIATAYKLVKAEISLVETQLPASGADGTVHVQANANSLLYQGANLTVNLTWDNTTLASVVTTTDLPGFDPGA